MEDKEILVLYALLYANFSEARNATSIDELLDGLSCAHCLRKKACMCAGRNYRGDEALACIVKDFISETGMDASTVPFMESLARQ